MKILQFMAVSLLVSQAAYGARMDHKATAQQALDYVKQVREQTCNEAETLSLDSEALPFLMKLSDSDEFKAVVCVSESDRHCDKNELPTSFHVELNALTACMQGHMKPHIPQDINKICCDAASHVEEYLKTYLKKPTSESQTSK